MQKIIKQEFGSGNKSRSTNLVSHKAENGIVYVLNPFGNGNCTTQELLKKTNNKQIKDNFLLKLIKI